MKSCSTSKSSGSQKSFILCTLDKKCDTPTKPTNVSQTQVLTKKPYIMIQPRLIESLDKNNQKRRTIQFENHIQLMQTLQISQSEKLVTITKTPPKSARDRKINPQARLSLRVPTQI